MDFNNLLSQLNLNNNRETVYLSVTPGVGLELIQLDVQAKSVKNYSFRPLEYKDSLREIQDMEAFKNAIVELFNELNISLKSDIILNLPMVLFGNRQLPLLLGDDAIDEALISEVEQSYIFKRYEPKVAWIDASSFDQSGDMRKLFYTALQSNVIDNIKTILSELGASLVGLEISLTSLLKGLAYTGLITEQLKEGTSWNLMIINQNGYSICSMVGKRIIDFYEEPLAIKSFENDEIYNAINASAQIALMSYPANYLFIVSETNLVSAEILAAKLKTDGIVNYYENNDFKKQDLIPVNLNVLEDAAHKISLEAIGIASGNVTEFPTTFDFVGTGDKLKDNPNELVNIQIGNTNINISPNTARNIAAVFAVILLIPMLLLSIAMPMVIKSKQAKLDELNKNNEILQNKIKQMQNQDANTQDFDTNGEIKKVLTSNRAKLMAYMALGDSVPKQLWLTYFVAQDDGKFDIKGESGNVEDVYAFYKNMKDSLINTKLRLNKLEMTADTDTAVNTNGAVDYEFEITNMSSAELMPPNENNDNNNNTNQNGSNNGNVADNAKPSNSNMLNKPLLNFN